jgi:hypothetical protein
MADTKLNNQRSIFFCFKDIKNFPGVDITSAYEMNTVYRIEIKHVNRPLHLYMLEMFTPYLFKSNRRKTSQEHPSAKERSSVLKTLKTVGTIYVTL